MAQINFYGKSFVWIESEKNIYINPFFSNFVWQESYRNAIVILTDKYLEDNLSSQYKIASSFFVSSNKNKEFLLKKFNLSKSFIKTDKKMLFWNVLFEKIGQNFFESFSLFIEWKKIVYVWSLNICDYLFEFYYNNTEKIDLLVFPLQENSKNFFSKALELIKILAPKQVLPLNFSWKDWTLFAKEVMLNNLSVPKVLRAWQYIVI